MCLIAIVSFFAGGATLWLPFALTVLLAVLGDALLGDDQSTPDYKHTGWLNLFLYLNLPLLLIAQFALYWQSLSGDPLGFGAWFDLQWGSATDASAFSLLAAKAETSFWDRVGAFLGLGLLFGIAATNVAHELVHRTWSPFSQEVGRWLLAFTWDGEFAVEHVYGHHRKVATWEDPASARRGENFFSFFRRSLIGGNTSAWHIEKSFLHKRNLPLWSRHNRLLRGWSISLFYAALGYAIGGLNGLALHLGLALYGKCYLELVNYIEHYGLVRLPQSPVQLRHSWNSNASISSWFLFNLTRHSHHHATGHLPFWKLKPQSDAPRLPFGYMTMLAIALVPPLFKAIMDPYLKRWDEVHATPAERALLGPARA